MFTKCAELISSKEINSILAKIIVFIQLITLVTGSASESIVILFGLNTQSDRKFVYKNFMIWAEKEIMNNLNEISN